MRHLVISSLLLVLAACQSKPSKAPTGDRLELLGKSAQKQIEKRELSRINRDIKRLRAQDLKSLEAPVRKPMPAFVNADSLYTEAIKYFREGDLGGLRFFQVQLEKSFPKSLHLDNAYFLVGISIVKKGAYARALPYFERIINDFPRSNKRASALLHKGMLYRELNLTKQAKRVLTTLRKEYKGSPEYFQAEMELKLLKVKTSS